MRKRNVAILFRLNKKEAEVLDKKVKKSGLNRCSGRKGYGYNKEINIYPYCDLDSILRGCTIIDITGSQSQFRLDSKYFNYNIPIYIGEMDDFHNLFDINSINEFRNDDKLDNIYRIVQQYL